MSYVECMECGDELKLITPRHLKRHGLTSEEYREKYPTVKMASDLWSKERAKTARDRRFKRSCEKCGKPFITGCPRAYYCPKCQMVRRVQRKRQVARIHAERRINSNVRVGVGTFGEWYLEVIRGRIRGAVLLEDHKSINSYWRSFKGSAPADYEACLIIYLIEIILKRRRSCEECGSELIVARENEVYTIPAEICCQGCGLVYELDDLQA